MLTCISEYSPEKQNQYTRRDLLRGIGSHGHRMLTSPTIFHLQDGDPGNPVVKF